MRTSFVCLHVNYEGFNDLMRVLRARVVEEMEALAAECMHSSVILRRLAFWAQDRVLRGQGTELRSDTCEGCGSPGVVYGMRTREGMMYSCVETRL